MPRLFGSPPSRQILEYTTQAKQGKGPLRSPLVLHSPGITFGKHQRGAGKILLTPARQEFWGFLRGKARSVQAHTLGLQSFTEPRNYTVLSEELL